MPQLIVRGIEERVVRKLKQRAGEHGVSMEEEHRRILRAALLNKRKKEGTIKEYLLAMPDIDMETVFVRPKGYHRKVEL
jgi:plasmid stability protein